MGIKVDDICFLYERGTAMQVNALDHVSAEIPDNQFIREEDLSEAPTR